MVHDGVRGLGHPPFTAWSGVHHRLLHPEHGLRVFGKPYLLVRLSRLCGLFKLNKCALDLMGDEI